MNFGMRSVFEMDQQKKIPEECDVVFVADLFLQDYVGGAELTTEALISAAALRVHKIRSRDVTIERLQEGFQKFWIFGNYSELNPELIPTIVGNLKYAVIEYDYKFCRYRSIEKHLAAEGTPCDCHNQINGKMISAFLYGARSLWWMSENQMRRHEERFPFLGEKSNTVLSSVFDDQFFATIHLLNEKYKDSPRSGWIVIGSPSWIKGTDDAIDWCNQNNLTHEVVWNLPYDQLLEKLAQAEGLAFLPKGADTCPRLVIEAKLLGCKLHLNDNVQHKDEIWFDTDDLLDTESYLYMARQRFWNGIKHDMEYVPTVSGYTTTLNCVEQRYPFEASIASMLGFCDEVVVVDGGSTDGTWEKLCVWAASEPKLQLSRNTRDWSHPRFARFDGEQKAYARSLCTSTFCWQQDSDEVVHENDFEKIQNLLREFPNSVQLLSLPVIEYWGGPGKIRMDIFPWKWRLSRNLPHITHGIPGQLRRFDDNGELYSAPGSDGCDYIHLETHDPIPNATFYTADVDAARRQGMTDPVARENYGNWFKMMTQNLPSIHHYSWFSLARKIRTYRDYWSKHWQSLYNIPQDDIAENNMFFDRSWSDVSEDDIEKLAIRLGMEMGGWIFHSRVDFTKPTPYLTAAALNYEANHPKFIHTWITSCPEFSFNADVKDELRQELDRLLVVKGNDNWRSVRDPENHFVLTPTDTVVGLRKIFVLQSEKRFYEDLQQSRGLTINYADDIDRFVGRALSEMNVLYPSDQVRLAEINGQFTGSPNGVAEIGFRIPRLLRYFKGRGSQVLVGCDVAKISTLFARGVGYDNVHQVDLDTSAPNLDLGGCDLVMCYHVLEHVSDPMRALHNIYAAMDAGATLHVEVPLEEDVPNIYVAHVFPFQKHDLGMMLNFAGFSVVKMSTNGHEGSGLIERYIAVKQ